MLCLPVLSVVNLGASTCRSITIITASWISFQDSLPSRWDHAPDPHLHKLVGEAKNLVAPCHNLTTPGESRDASAEPLVVVVVPIRELTGTDFQRGSQVLPSDHVSPSQLFMADVTPEPPKSETAATESSR